MTPSKNDSLLELLISGLYRRLYTGAALIVAIGNDIQAEHYVGEEKIDGTTISPFHFFDLASLTKPIAVAFLFMKAVEEGIITLDYPLNRFFPPNWISRHFAEVTLDDILSHRAGFPAYVKFYEHIISIPPYSRRESLLREILISGKEPYPVYSDLGYMVLGHILELIYENSLDEIFKRLAASGDAQRLNFLPFVLPSHPLEIPGHCEQLPLTVSTGWCPWRKRLLKGEVHDENCFCLGGVSGHAGLFGTARAIFSWISDLWKSYTNNSGKYYSQSTVMEFFSKPDSSWSWARGFDTPTPGQSLVAPYFSELSVGHYGFTGTSFWLDLKDGLTVILLTNRVYFGIMRKEFQEFRRHIHYLARTGKGSFVV